MRQQKKTLWMRRSKMRKLVDIGIPYAVVGMLVHQFPARDYGFTTIFSSELIGSRRPFKN